MSKFLKQYRLVIIAIVIFLAMALTAWFLVRPLYGKVLSLRDEIQKERVRQENQQKQIKRLPELKSQYERVVSEEGFLDILLTEDKVVGFIRTIEGLASDAQVDVKIQSNDLKVEEIPQKKSNKIQVENSDEDGSSQSNDKKEKTLADYLPYPDYLRLTLTVSGDHGAIISFLSRLETLPVALDVMGVDVKQPLRDDNSREGDVRAVNPFTTDTGQQGDTNKEGDNVPEELTQALSPKLEAVIDLIVYVDKK